MMAKKLIFDTSLKNIELLFKVTGFTIEPRKKNLKEYCILLLNLLWLNTDILCVLFWSLKGLTAGENIMEITFVAPCEILSILGDIKFLFLVINEGKVQNLVTSLRDLEMKNQYENMDEDRIIKPETKFLDIITKVLNILNCLMIIVFDLSPLILIAVKYYTTGQLKLMLPFMDVYPFDAFNLKYWPFMYIHQVWSESIVLLYICATDYLFFTCCTHIRIQFKLLQQQFEDTISERASSAASEYDDVIINREYFKIKFKELIKWHQQIIRSAGMLEDVYSKSILFNFVISSLVICLTGFNVTIINDITFVMTFMTFLFLSLLQVFFLCLFGDILMNSSLEIADSVFKCKWYSGDVAAGKNVLIIQTRAQKPCKVTAAGFADVNLHAFMKILSTSWSYFALLQTMYGSRE